MDPLGIDLRRAQGFERLSEARQLLVRLGGYKIFGGSEMGEHARHPQTRELAVMLDEGCQPVERHSQAAHACINFQMEVNRLAEAARDLGISVQTRCG